MKTKLRISQWTKGMAKYSKNFDQVGVFYVTGRAVNLFPENIFATDRFVVYASTVVPSDDWKIFIEKLKLKYASLELSDSKQEFRFDNDADEAAFIMESSDWIDL